MPESPDFVPCVVCGQPAVYLFEGQDPMCAMCPEPRARTTAPDPPGLMPEFPDFDQIARQFAQDAMSWEDGMSSEAEDLAELAEQLRQVWNARGAADRAKVEHELSTMMGSNMAGPYLKNLDRALRRLDALVTPRASSTP